MKKVQTNWQRFQKRSAKMMKSEKIEAAKRGNASLSSQPAGRKPAPRLL